MSGRRVVQVAVVFLSWVASDARGGGFEIPDHGARAVGRGGAFTAKADDLTAIALNPGGLSRVKGTRFLYSHNLIWHPTTFERAPSSIPRSDPYAQKDAPLSPVHNGEELFPLGMMGVLSSDFGLEDWTFAIGVYGPNAVGKLDYPVDGGQRYMLTSTDILLMYYSAAVSYGWKDVFGVGVTLQYVHMPKTEFSLVVDATPGGAVNPYYSSADVEATLRLKDDFAFSAVIGAWWRVIPELELGVAGRIVPVYLDPEGDVVLRNVPGQAEFTPEQLQVNDSYAKMPLTLPMTARLGLRYRHLDGDREVFDIELDAVYESWSMLESYDVELSGESNLFTATPLPDLTIAKAWRDTVSVRLGGSVEPVPDWFGISAGAYWERGAVPKAYTHLDFLSLDRWGVGGGLRFTHWGIDLSVSYLHVFQPSVDVSEAEGKVFQQRPLSPCPGAGPCMGGNGAPANAGHFESSYDILALSLELHFNEWF
ncbi:MAG: hypothetical protein AMXMBFR64_27390 [Myxococcales bacterium]